MVSQEKIRSSIKNLLSEMMEKKLTAKQKELDSLLNKGLSKNSPKVEAVLKSLAETEDSYQYDNWLRNAAYSMTKSTTLATHISKGVHSMSRGDNVLFKNNGDRPRYIAGSHNIISDVVDISGSAAALPIYNFINLEVDGVKIKELIEQASPAMIGALSDDTEIALGLLDRFQAFLSKQVEAPSTSDINKQMLFPKNGDSFEIESVDELEYETVVPLYASVFLHEVRNKINSVRYNDDYREAIKNRFSQDANNIEHTPYKTINDLALIKLGGSKPANISKVVVMSAGEMILLSNNPPPFDKISKFYVPKYIGSVFDSVKINAMLKRSLENLAYATISYDKRPIYKTKTYKRIALDKVITDIFTISLKMKENKAGWLADHALHEHEKYWLDPLGLSFEGLTTKEVEHKQRLLRKKAVLMISNYINTSLKALNGEHADIFNADNFNDIRKQLEVVAGQFKRNNMEVFYDYQK